MNYKFEATITDIDTDEVIAKISGLSQESLEEEMGKSKWTKAIENYEDKTNQELIDEKIEQEVLEEKLKNNDNPEKLPV